MRIFDIANPLDGDDMFPIYAYERSQTCIYRRMMYFLYGGIILGHDLSDTVVRLHAPLT